MAERLRFYYTRLATIEQHGTCSVDVDDPTNADEIRERLSNKEFTELRPLLQTFDNERFSFEPMSDDG